MSEGKVLKFYYNWKKNFKNWLAKEFKNKVIFNELDFKKYNGNQYWKVDLEFVPKYRMVGSVGIWGEDHKVFFKVYNSVTGKRSRFNFDKKESKDLFDFLDQKLRRYKQKLMKKKTLEWGKNNKGFRELD